MSDASVLSVGLYLSAVHLLSAHLTCRRLLLPWSRVGFSAVPASHSLCADSVAVGLLRHSSVQADDRQFNKRFGLHWAKSQLTHSMILWLSIFWRFRSNCSMRNRKFLSNVDLFCIRILFRTKTVSDEYIDYLCVEWFGKMYCTVENAITSIKNKQYCILKFHFIYYNFFFSGSVSF